MNKKPENNCFDVKSVQYFLLHYNYLFGNWVKLDIDLNLILEKSPILQYSCLPIYQEQLILKTSRNNSIN